MAFNNPVSTHNPATGVVIPSAWGDIVNADLLALFGKPRVRVARGSTQSILSGPLVAVLFDGEHVDTHGMHSTSSNTSRLTIPTNWGGDWVFLATTQWQVNSGGTRRHTELLLNGSLKLIDDEIPATASGYATQTLLTLWPGAVAGDYVEHMVNHDAGVNLNVQNDGYAGTIFQAWFVGSGVG